MLLLLYLGLLAILVLLYRGTYFIEVSLSDLAYIPSSANKWFMVSLTVVLVIGMILDLYYTSAVKTYWMMLMPKPPPKMTSEELKK